MFQQIGFSALLTLSMTSCLCADERQDQFVEANILAIFYHELAHAIIDTMKVPIFGQEEDAADVMAVLMINWLFDEQSAQSLAYDSAFGYLDPDTDATDVAWWDVHGPDEQRYYNHVCLFYGGNPDERFELAADLGLPEERADTCEEEYELAADSWSAVLDDMAPQDGQAGNIRFLADDDVNDALAVDVLQAEVAAISQELHFPDLITVRVASCGEANAFYDPSEVSITYCSEFTGDLREIFDITFD